MKTDLKIFKFSPIHIIFSSFLVLFANDSHAITFDAFNYFPTDRVDGISAATSSRGMGRFGTGQVLDTVDRHRSLIYRNNTVTLASLDALEASGSTRRNTIIGELRQNSQGGVSFNYDYTTGSSLSLVYDNGIYGLGGAHLTERNPAYTGTIDYTNYNLDLTEGGATALEVDLLFNFAQQIPLSIDFTLYDNSDPTGNTFSAGNIQISEAVFNDPKTFSLDFSALNSFGANGAADLTRIGAMVLRFDTSAMTNFDMSIFRYGTNGVSGGGGTEIPEPMTLVLLGASGLYCARRKQLRAL